jgi:hypothetical protein
MSEIIQRASAKAEAEREKKRKAAEIAEEQKAIKRAKEEERKAKRRAAEEAAAKKKERDIAAAAKAAAAKAAAAKAAAAQAAAAQAAKDAAAQAAKDAAEAAVAKEEEKERYKKHQIEERLDGIENMFKQLQESLKTLVPPASSDEKIANACKALADPVKTVLPPCLSPFEACGRTENLFLTPQVIGNVGILSGNMTTQQPQLQQLLLHPQPQANHFYVDAGGIFPARQPCSFPLPTFQTPPVPQLHSNEFKLQVLRMMGLNI